MGKKRYLVLFLAFLVVMTLLTVFGKNGLLHVFRLKRELEKLTEVNQSVQLENATLLEEINYLRDHEGYLELQAHRQGLVKEGEIVFQLREDH
jgi:cell division protein FtsB